MKHFIAVLTFAALSGCATSSLNYTPPKQTSINNQITVPEPFDIVWDRLVRKLASDFFVINNIEKASRLINVSFSVANPTDFVSCGQSTRELSSPSGDRTYKYDPAGPTVYTFANQRGFLFNANRRTSLEGRSNVYVAPEGNGETLISVNTKYVVDVDLKYTDDSGNPAGGGDAKWVFSTKQPYSDSDGVVCVANGELERKILQYGR